jgi:hypothetical protein
MGLFQTACLRTQPQVLVLQISLGMDSTENTSSLVDLLQCDVSIAADYVENTTSSNSSVVVKTWLATA